MHWPTGLICDKRWRKHAKRIVVNVQCQSELFGIAADASRTSRGLARMLNCRE